MSRVFTNDRIPFSPTWDQAAEVLPFREEGTGTKRPLRALANAVATLKRAKRDDIVIFSNSHNLSASLYGLLHRGRLQRPTLVRTDPLLTFPGKKYFQAKRRYLQAAFRGVDRVIVWSEAVIDRYACCFGFAPDRMVALRFHHTLTGYSYGPVRSGDYIFSGGDSMRDYPTFIEAVRGLPIPVIIATRSAPPAGVTLPANVTLKSVTHVEFRELLAGARLAVFPLRTDNVRTSGAQSYLNAMALGKAVIVTDPVDASFYIEDGQTGMLVPSGDIAALRGAITRVLDDPNLARRLGENARQAALPLDQEYTWSRVLRIAEEAHADRFVHALVGR